jgi:NADH-quinone oxidoreductase subunit L
MTLPLVALAVLSLIGGFFNVSRWLEPLFPGTEPQHNELLVAISVAAGLIGIGLAYWFYVARPGLADSVAARLGVLYRLVYNKYFVDEVYHAVVVESVVDASRDVLWKNVDAGVIDGTVNGIGARARGVGGVLRLLQSGNIRSYATWVLIGSLGALVALGLMGGTR